MDPNSVRLVSYKRREMWTQPHTQREDGLGEMRWRSEVSSHRPRNTSMKSPQAGRGREGSSCEASRQDLDFTLPNSRTM